MGAARPPHPSSMLPFFLATPLRLALDGDLSGEIV
jgi:hypothetical protein